MIKHPPPWLAASFLPEPVAHHGGDATDEHSCLGFQEPSCQFAAQSRWDALKDQNQPRRGDIVVPWRKPSDGMPPALRASNGASSRKYVPWVVLDPVFVQKRHDLLLKSHFAMMLLLIPDITP